MTSKPRQKKTHNLPKPNWERGEVVLIDLNPPKDKYEIGKIRPVVNIQEISANKYSPNITFVPFSASTLKRQSSIHIKIDKGEGGVKTNCFALCNQIRTTSKSRIIGRLGNLRKSKLLQIDKGIKIHLDLFFNSK